MVFSSLLFLFRFLPLVLICYFIAPRGLRNLILFLFSLVFYAWGEPVYVVLMMVSILISYLGGIFVDRFKQAGERGKGKGSPGSVLRPESVSSGIFQIRGFRH